MPLRVEHRAEGQMVADMAVQGRKAGELLTRFMPIRAEDIKEGSREVQVSFSSETNELRSFYTGAPEMLLHEKSAASFADLERTGSVLFNHNANVIVGRPKDVKLDTAERKGRATIVFDDDPDADRVFKKVQGDSLRGVSVGFRVNKWQILGDGETWKSPEGRSFTGPADIAVSWRAKEFSLTPIPADGAVGVGRNTKGAASMDDDDNTGQTDGDGGGARSATDRTRLEERHRIAEIRDLCGLYPETRDLADGLVESGASAEQASRQIHLRLLETRKPLPNERPTLGVGRSGQEKWKEATVAGLLERAGVKRADKVEPRHHVNLADLARDCLERDGVNTRAMRPADLALRAFSHSTSDFPKILANVGEKSLLQGYEEAPQTWRPLVRIAAAKDFKSMSRPRLGDFGDLIITPELTPMHEGSLGETGEIYAISTYSKRFGISREAITNDDLGAFTEVPRLMGQAAKRLVSKLFYDLLISGAGTGPSAMAEDGLPLFSSTHTSGSNYIAAAGTPDETGLSAARKLMRKQKGLPPANETAATLNIVPKFLLVPSDLETAAAKTLNSIWTPGKTSEEGNVFYKSLELIVEPRLDAATNGTTAWYIISDPNVTPGAEIAFLGGREEPTMVRIEGTNVLGMQFGVYLDVGAKFLDHRGWVRTRGA